MKKRVEMYGDKGTSARVNTTVNCTSTWAIHCNAEDSRFSERSKQQEMTLRVGLCVVHTAPSITMAGHVLIVAKAAAAAGR